MVRASWFAQQATPPTVTEGILLVASHCHPIPTGQLIQIMGILGSFLHHFISSCIPQSDGVLARLVRFTFANSNHVRVHQSSQKELYLIQVLSRGPIRLFECPQFPLGPMDVTNIVGICAVSINGDILICGYEASVKRFEVRQQCRRGEAGSRECRARCSTIICPASPPLQTLHEF